MTEAKDTYRTLFCWFFFKFNLDAKPESWSFYSCFGRLSGGHILQWATPCTSWRSLLCQLLSNPHPSSHLLYDTCCFSYLKICARCLLKRCCMYVWGRQHWSCLLCNGQPESALTQAVLGELTYATCKERPGNCISWKGSEWGLSFQKSLSLTNDFSLAYEYNVSFHRLMNETSF